MQYNIRVMVALEDTISVCFYRLRQRDPLAIPVVASSHDPARE